MIFALTGCCHVNTLCPFSSVPSPFPLPASQDVKVDPFGFKTVFKKCKHLFKELYRFSLALNMQPCESESHFV